MYIKIWNRLCITELIISLFINFISSYNNFKGTYFILIVTASAPLTQDGEVTYKDWVFINYTFKRFEGLTQRGTPTKK